MRHLFRLLLLIVIVALGTWLFYIGREHQVFLDNKTIEAGGQSFKALDLVHVSINGGDPLEFMPRDRDMTKAVGPTFKVKVEVMDEDGEKAVKTIEKTLTPGFSKDMMISLPLLVAERSDFILPPPGVQQPAPEETPAPPAEGLPTPSMGGAETPPSTETPPPSNP